MIYDSKLNYATEFDNDVKSPYITFTSRADIFVKDEEYAVSVSNDYVSRHIVLNNNITLTCNNSYDEICGIDLLKSNSDKDPTIYSNNAAKNTKVSLKTSSYCNAYGWLIDDMSLLIGGSVMLHNFNISAVCTLSDAYADGIEAYYLVSDADFRGNFTVTSKAESNANSHGIDTIVDFSAKDISGKFKIASTSSKGDAKSYGVSCSDFNSEKLSGNFDITAVTKTGDDWYNAYAYAFKTAAFSVKRGFAGSINVKSNASESDSYAYAFAATQIKLQGKSTGSISVTAQGGVSAESYGLTADRIILANYSGNISCKSVAGADSDREACAYGLYSRYWTGYAITFYGDFSGKLNVSAENKNKTAEKAIACGIYSYENDLLMDDIAGVWNISAQGYTAEAYGIVVYDNVTLGNISGNKTVTAKSYSSAVGVNAYGFRGYDVSIGRISDKITVSATGYAYGFFAQNSLQIKDMSKMNLSVTSSDGSACAINVECAEYGENKGFILDSPVFNFGKVSAVGKWGTIGLSADTITGYDSSRSRIEGSITATSKAYRATGIILSSVSKDIVFSSTISATGKTEAYGISFGSGILILDNAKITAKVTGKGYEQNAFVLYTEDSQKNTITITGNSVLTGLISTGKGNDTVYMDSGSKVIGGFSGVTSLYLNINDASQKNNVMWQASGITSQTYTSISVEFGLLGDFKIISKSNDIDWTKLFSNNQFDAMQNNLVKGNELYTQGFYKKGNDLYVKASLKNALGDDAEVIQEKAAGDYSLHKKYTVFTNEADLTVKNSSSAIKANLAQHTLVLDNNITVDLKDFSDYAYGVSSSADKFTLVSNNAAKMLKVSGKGSTLSTVAGYDMKNTALKIQGGRFLQNATVSGQNTGVGDLEVYGIIAADLDGTAQGLNCAATDIAGNFTVSGKATGELSVYGMKTGKFIARDISGKFNITSDSSDTVTTYALFAESMTLDKLTGNFTVKSTGNADYNDWSRAAALFTDGKEDGKDLVITNGFSGSIAVDVKDKYKVKAFGISAGSDLYYTASNLILGGRNTGSVKVSAQGDSGAYAYGIFAENSATLTNFSGAITAKATAKGDETVSAYAICQEEIEKSLDFIGTFSSKITVSTQNKKMDKGTVYAHAVYAQSNISADDITGVWNISAQGYDAGAYGLYTVNGGSINVGNISGNKTISAQSSNKNTTRAGYAFHSADTFTANKISDAIKISATGSAYGFYSNNGFLVNDMSKMQLTVTSSNNKAYGIQVYNFADGNLVMDKSGLHLGKITVNGYTDAYGIFVGNNIYTVDDCQNNRLEGTITVKSQNGFARGIQADRFSNDDGNNAVVCSANISVTGKNGSSAIDIMYGDLTFDNATVTAKVTDKNSVENSYAVYAIYDDNNISLTGKSKITGNIWTGSGKDKVSIESGSKLVGAMEGVETVEIILNDKSQAKQSLWDVTMDSGDAVDLDINFDYGMTGDFLLATKKSDFDWDDVIDLSQCSLLIDGNTTDLSSLGCSYGDFSFELQEKGNKLILSVTEMR